MAVRFDAAADRLTHNGSYPQTSAGWTMTCWVRLKVDRNDWSTFFRTSNGGNTIANIGVNSDGVIGPGYYTGPGSIAFTDAPTSPDTGVWYCVAATRNATTGDTKIYRKVNGTAATQAATCDLAPTDLTSTPDQVCIGGRGSADANEWWDGDVCHVRIWSTELTQAEIEAEWASPTPVKSSGLHSNWPLYSYGDYTDTVGSKTLTPQSGGISSAANGPLLGTQNLCTNPTGKVDTTGWVNGAAHTVTSGNNVNTALPVRATGLLALGFPVDTGLKSTAGGYFRSAQSPVIAGQTYTISFWGRGNGATAQLQTCYVVWYNASGTDLSYDNLGSFGASTSTNVHRKAATLTAPTNAVAVGLIVDAGGADCCLSCVKVEQGSTAYDYADGDTAGWQWNGTAGLSTSEIASGGGSTTGVIAGLLPTPTGSLAGVVSTSGALAGSLPTLGGSLTGIAQSTGVLAGSLPTPGGALAGTVTWPPISGALAGVLPGLTGALSGNISATGLLAGSLPTLGGSLAGGTPTTLGAVAGALPGLGGTLTGSLSASGQLSGELVGLSGSLTGLIRTLGALGGVLPTLGGSLNDVITVLTQDAYALAVQRENTKAFIDADPFSVTLRTRTAVRTATGGVSMTDAAFRATQVGKLIMISPAGGSIEQRTEDGTERQVDYILLMEWDAEIEVGDWWDDQHGNRWEVKALIPTNNYEIRAVVEAHGKTLTGG